MLPHAKKRARHASPRPNHFVAALWALVKIELLKAHTKKNHYQLKSQLYLSALQVAFKELQSRRAQLAQQPATA